MLGRICNKFKGSGKGIQIHNQVTADTKVAENIIGAHQMQNDSGVHLVLHPHRISPTFLRLD